MKVCQRKLWSCLLFSLAPFVNDIVKKLRSSSFASRPTNHIFVQNFFISTSIRTLLSIVNLIIWSDSFEKLTTRSGKLFSKWTRIAFVEAEQKSSRELLSFSEKIEKISWWCLLFRRKFISALLYALESRSKKCVRGRSLMMMPGVSLLSQA